MEQNYITAKKRKEREQKLERISLYWEWEDREPGEAHMTWEQWMKIRKLRKQKNQKGYVRKDKPETQTYSGLTGFGVVVEEKCWHNTYQEFQDYIHRLTVEFQELNKYSTKELLSYYKSRWFCCGCHYWSNTRCNTCRKFQGFMYESFKYVLDTREHIPRRSKSKNPQDRVKHKGKKDKRQGRKNPTNRR